MDQIPQSDEIIENTSIKICVIGPEGVGKSSIINQLCGREFDPEIKTTTCYKIDSVDYKIKNNDITINFWDCGAYHDKSYYDVKCAFYRGSLLALIVFDVNDIETIKNELDYWIDDCDEFGACQKYIIINKIDSLEQICYSKQNKTISIGFSIEAKEQIQLTDLKEKPPTEYLEDISNFLNDSKIKYIYGSVILQGYQKNIIDFINENSIYNLQKYESDKRGLKKNQKEQTQSFINNINVSQNENGKCTIQ